MAISRTSIKKNFAYKSALTLSSYIMTFITFPYVSRVLGVERMKDTVPEYHSENSKFA